MRKTKGQKAITLIALIITIVVLLILAVVAINAVTGDGIIQHAVNAKTEYEKAQEEEKDLLSYYGQYLDAKGKSGDWVQNETSIKNVKTGKEIKIGDYVNYNPKDLKDGVDSNKTSYTSVGEGNTLVTDTNGEYKNQTFSINDEYNDGWRVLGVENGKILLVSATNIGTLEINLGQVYIIGENELINICAIYGNGKGAESARSIKIEDINRITGYNPEVYNYYEEGFEKYGPTITYTSDGTNILYSTSEGKTGTLTGNRINRIIGNQWLNEVVRTDEEYKITSNIYSYKVTDYINDDNLLCSSRYWLASKCSTYYYEGGEPSREGLFCLRQCNSKGIVYFRGATGVVDDIQANKVRPVIVLDANAELVLSSDGTSYDIKL